MKALGFFAILLAVLWSVPPAAADESTIRRIVEAKLGGTRVDGFPGRSCGSARSL